LNDNVLAQSDAAHIHSERSTGIAIRLGAEDMLEEPEDIDGAISDILRQSNADRTQADLLFDLGPVHGDLPVRHGSRLVAGVLRDLGHVDEWRQIAVVAGAFPADLSDVSPWVLGEARRYDADLWDRLQTNRHITRRPTYGDYAVTHPLPPTGPPYPPSPSLRYTIADRWLILKGRRNDPRGNEQFYEVCEHIARHMEFAGAALGRADERIANARAHGKPGNATIWREIATTHHLDFVVRRITTLGEP
jgi:hypothetical protein